jgi:hypothetical protein
MLGELLDTFFTDEWVRFSRGLAKLDPEQQRLAMLAQGRRTLQPGETATVTIPGWDQIIKLGPRYQPNVTERKAYYDALRGGYAPDISREARAAMDYSMAAREAMRTSAQPGYAQAFGEVLTAVDNVQDFFSTVATLGRLGLWGITLGFNALAPGLSAQLAGEAGQLAARVAQQAAATGWERALLDAVARGEPVAKFLLGDAAALAGARRAAVEAAGKLAYQSAFRSALLGLGSRAALRLLPIVGWVLLASDLLNMLNLFGLLAMPAYAALCKGPTEALAAGVPAAVFKNALKREAWKNMMNNPFSRAGRASRAARSLGKLPSFVNLIEVAQTTENLFGIGITLGGLTGAMIESAYAFQRMSNGEATRLNMDSFNSSFTDPNRALATGAGQTLSQLGQKLHNTLGSRLTSQTLADQYKNQQAAAALSLAPAIMGVQDTFDEETHLKTMIAYAAAVSTLAPLLRGLDWQPLLADMADVTLTAPWPPSTETVEWAAALGYDLEPSHRFWWDGAGPTCTGREYMEHHAAAVAQATRDYITPRRNTVEAAFYGRCVNAITEAVWLMLEDDPHFFKWELTTDSRLLASLMEAGRLINTEDGENKLWGFWQRARNLIEQTGKTSLLSTDWDNLAIESHITLIKLLPPGSPWPQEWENWIQSEEDKARQNHELPPTDGQEWLY